MEHLLLVAEAIPVHWTTSHYLYGLAEGMCHSVTVSLCGVAGMAALVSPRHMVEVAHRSASWAHHKADQGTKVAGMEGGRKPECMKGAAVVGMMAAVAEHTEKLVGIVVVEGQPDHRSEVADMLPGLVPGRRMGERRRWWLLVAEHKLGHRPDMEESQLAVRSD